MTESPRRPRLAGLITSLVTLLVVALLLEGFLRFRYSRSLDFSMEMWKYARSLKTPVEDPRLCFRHAPNGHAFLMGAQVDINSQGLRDREYPLAKPDGVYRVLLLGDSTTFGWGVTYEDTTAKILEKELNEKGGGQKFEVLNAGVGNYCTVQEVTYYQTYGAQFQPDLVILEYFINDAEPVPREKKGLLVDSSYLVTFVTSRLDVFLRQVGSRPDWKQYYSSLYNDDKPGWIAAQSALRDLARSTREHHARLLVTILPELHQINETYPFAEAHEKLKKVLATESVPVLELLDGLRDHGPESTLWVTPADDHPNGKANHLIAAQTRDWILAQLRTPHPPAP